MRPMRGVDNMWDDIPGLGTTPSEDVGYPTQKTEALLRRIIAAATDPDDLVLDCFMGSGTTAAVAQKMGRRLDRMRPDRRCDSGERGVDCSISSRKVDPALLFIEWRTWIVRRRPHCFRLRPMC